MQCIKCNTEIPQKRIEILQKMGNRITCLECSETQKFTGFQVNSGKSERELEICKTVAQYKRLRSLERKGGGATGGPGFRPNEGRVIYKGK